MGYDPRMRSIPCPCQSRMTQESSEVLISKRMLLRLPIVSGSVRGCPEIDSVGCESCLIVLQVVGCRCYVRVSVAKRSSVDKNLLRSILIPYASC